MLDAEDAVLRFGACAVFDQLLQVASARNEGIDQVAIERIGCCAQALQGDAVFRFALLQLQGKLAASPQPPCKFTRGDSERLPDGAYPPLRWTRNLPRRVVWLQSAI